MILILGGAYQGKRDYAIRRFSLKEEDIFTCTGGEIDFSRKCVDKIEEFTWNCPDPVSYFQENREKWADSVLICRDISGGVVPLGADRRQWQRKNGALCQYLASEAAEVVRVFCGLEQRLK